MRSEVQDVNKLVWPHKLNGMLQHSLGGAVIFFFVAFYKRAKLGLRSTN